jgi:hypothetical protein
VAAESNSNFETKHVLACFYVINQSQKQTHYARKLEKIAGCGQALRGEALFFLDFLWLLSCIKTRK